MVLSGKRKMILVIVSLIIVIIVALTAHFFLERLNQRNQQKAAVLYQQGEQMRIAGKYQEAVQIYAEIIQKYAGYSDIPEVRFKFANVILHQLNNIQQAKEQYTQILVDQKRHPNNHRIPAAMIELAVINRYENKYNEAIRLYSRVLEEYPGYGDKKWLYFQLEMLYALTGNKEKSSEWNIKRRAL